MVLTKALKFLLSSDKMVLFKVFMSHQGFHNLLFLSDKDSKYESLENNKVVKCDGRTNVIGMPNNIESEVLLPKESTLAISPSMPIDSMSKIEEPRSSPKVITKKVMSHIVKKTKAKTNNPCLTKAHIQKKNRKMSWMKSYVMTKKDFKSTS